MENKLISGAYGFALNMSSKTVNFPLIPQLKNKRIKHIDVFDSASFTKTHDNKDIAADKVNAYLTVREANTSLELIQGLSLSLLNMNGARLFVNKIIDFENTYIEYRGAQNVINKSYYFVFYYDEPAAWSVLMQRGNRTSIKPLAIKLNGVRTYFRENLDLKGRKIQNLFLNYPSYTPSGDEVITANTAKNKFITLSKNNVEFFSRVPLMVFFQGNDYYPLRLQNITFDFQASYIETVTTTADDLKTVFFNAIIDDSK